MKNHLHFKVINLVAAMLLIITPFLHEAMGQGKIIASMDFNPRVNGLSFRNYGNNDHNWQNDLGAADLISMFGAEAVCIRGDNPENCVLKTAAKEWMMEQLDGMKGGRCEGVSAAALRFASGLPFNGMTTPADFQAGAANPFNLRRSPAIDNYIAYFFVTQTFREVIKPTKNTAREGPVAVVEQLVEAMHEGKDTYLLGIYASVNGEPKVGHAVLPFAVEENDVEYRIHVNDSNYPGETRFLTVEKGGQQKWSYRAMSNPNQPEITFAGDLETKTLELTATSWREGKCFKAPFASGGRGQTGCASQTGGETKAAQQTEEVEDSADFFINGEGDLLIIDGDGRRVGYDPQEDQFYDEIEGAEATSTKGGTGADMPHFILPFREDDEPYTIVFSGHDQDRTSKFDFTYSGPGFSVGFDGITLDPGEILIATVSPDGQELKFVETPDGAIPEISMALDRPEGSVKTVIKGFGLGGFQGWTGAEASKGGTLTVGFQPFVKAAPGLVVKAPAITGNVQIQNTGKEGAKFDVNVTKIAPNGQRDSIQVNDLGAGDNRPDNFELEVGQWNGGKNINVKQDDEGDGFENNKAQPVPNQKNNITDDEEIGNNLQGFFMSNFGSFSFNW